jgi:hypothetical protein
MKNSLKLASIAAAVAFAAVAQANPIVGSVGFNGHFTSDATTAGDLTTATTMTITGIDSVTGTGDLSGATAPYSFLTPIGVNAGPSIVNSQLWSVTVGGSTFTLKVDSESQVLTSAATIVLQGSGTLSDGAGPLEDTAGTWQVSFGASGDSFTWQGTSAANVPDGGMTAILLGVGISGLAMIRRKH